MQNGDLDEAPFNSVQSLSCVRLFMTPWITARQASLSITNTWSLLKLMSIELVMPFSHLILCRPLLLLPPIPPSIRVFSSESTLCMGWNQICWEKYQYLLICRRDYPYGRKQKEIKSPLIKVKEESENACLRLNIQKTKIMASGPTNSWQTDEERVETVRDFIFLGSEITADGDCSHEIKDVCSLE